MSVRIHPTAMVEENVTLGNGTSVWDNAHICHGASLGEQCIVGGKAYIAYDVAIGNRVKINAFAYICNMVGMGSVVTKSVPDFHLVYGRAVRRAPWDVSVAAVNPWAVLTSCQRKLS